MAEITNSDITNIDFQDDVDSYPHRTNYANIKNRHNQLEATVATIGTAASNAETVAARPFHSSLENRLSQIMESMNLIFSGFEVSERATPAMSIKVKAGSAQVAGAQCRKGFVTWARSGATVTVTEIGHDRSNGNTICFDVSSDETTIPLGEYIISGVSGDTYMITGVATGDHTGSGEIASILGTVVAPVNIPRWDTVVQNSDGSTSILTGSEAAYPVLPSRASTQKKLAHIYCYVGMTIIEDADIIDARKETSNLDLFSFEPIGTIKAWDKSFPNTPPIVKGDAWKECDGTVIDDPESPYFSQYIRELRDDRFLKGGATSGIFEASTNKLHDHGYSDPGHGHDIKGEELFGNPGALETTWYTPASLTATSRSGLADSNTTNISFSADGTTDAKPKNMSVVFIMRIK